jgi:excisionase family DNA binding protein
VLIETRPTLADDAVQPVVQSPEPPSSLRRWLSQQEAAEYIGVTDRSIRNYIRTGAIKGRRLPGSRLIRIDRLELDKALRPVPSGRAS